MPTNHEADKTAHTHTQPNTTGDTDDSDDDTGSTSESDTESRMLQHVDFPLGQATYFKYEV